MANSCPVCKLALTDTRNFSLETVSTIVYYPCNNVESGCQQCLPIEEIDEHHLICDYRSYACRLSKYCSWEGTRDELKKHYFAKHDNNILIGRECFSLWKQEKPDYTINVCWSLCKRITQRWFTIVTDDHGFWRNVLCSCEKKKRYKLLGGSVHRTIWGRNSILFWGKYK